MSSINKRITIKEVAKEAKVSPSTVGRAIGGYGYVSGQTRRKILKTAKKLNYHPNLLASNFRRQKTHTIGLIIPDVTNPFFTTVARGVEDQARKKQFKVFVCSTDEDPDIEKEYIDDLIQRRVEGFVIAPSTGGGKHLFDLQSDKIKFVVVDREVKNLKADIVHSDNVDGAYRLTNYLIKLGHRRIGIINGAMQTSVAIQRFTGYKKALLESNVPIVDALVKGNDWRMESSYKHTMELLTSKFSPTAIFAANNILGVGVLRALREMGLKVPTDMSVVCFDDVPVASLMYPFLTVVAQSPYTMGKLATQILLERRSGQGPAERQDIVLKPNFIIRESCRPPRNSGEIHILSGMEDK